MKVEVRKELEDLVKPDRMAAGRPAVFNNDFPVNRTREIVGPVPAPVGWIPRGRDANLSKPSWPVFVMRVFMRAIGQESQPSATTLGGLGTLATA